MTHTQDTYNRAVKEFHQAFAEWEKACEQANREETECRKKFGLNSDELLDLEAANQRKIEPLLERAEALEKAMKKARAEAQLEELDRKGIEL